MATKYDIPWPKNHVVQGQLSFPLTSEQDIDALQVWRLERKIASPQFPDKIGATLLLNQAQWDKAYDYLTETYLPFAASLWGLTNNEKGIDPELIADLLAQAKKNQWYADGDKKKRPNLPLRLLTPKDREYAGEEFVGKIKFSGPYQENMGKMAVVKDGDGKQVTQPVAKLVNVGGEDKWIPLIDGLPESRSNPNTLWWGAGWNFRTSLRFSAFDSASVGVTAYNTTLYLLPHLGMPVNARGEEEIIEDGDDWDDAVE